jgi:L-alanine-DL-glutamate epimerase-like enolase superfamily enzyme
MHITRVDAYPLVYVEPNDCNSTRHLMLVRVEGASGMCGWGEAVTIWPEPTLAAAEIVRGGLAQVVLGRDVEDVEALWLAQRDHMWWYGDTGLACFALSALDMALWDLKGKALGQPLHGLLGGKVTDRVRACASSHPNKATIDAMAAELAGMAAEGYTALKVGFGKKGDARLGQDMRRDLDFVAAVRSAIGPDVDFMVDIGYKVRYEVMQAVRVTRGFEQHGIRWIEDPLPYEDWDGYLRLRDAIQTPIATGERLWTVNDFRRLIERGIGDIILVDAGRAEGVTGWQRVSRLLHAAGRHVNAHAWSGAVLTAASLHLTATAPNHIIFELKPKQSPVQFDLVDRPVEQHGGWVEVRDTPGIGVEVDEVALQRHLMK